MTDPAPQPAPSTRRWTWLTARPSRWSVLVPVVTLVAGVLFSASTVASQGGELRPDVASLPELVAQIEQQNQRRADQVGEVQAQVQALERVAAPDQPAVGERAEAAARVAGLTAVTGPGLEVALSDSTIDRATLPEGVHGEDIIVHQQDVQAVMNVMWAAGAEAMTVMGQRIISTSAVRCVGNTVIVRGRVYSPPFRIAAIGDVARLREAVTTAPMLAGYRDAVRLLGLGWEIEDRESIAMPAYQGATDPSYATTEQGSGKGGR